MNGTGLVVSCLDDKRKFLLLRISNWICRSNAAVGMTNENKHEEDAASNRDARTETAVLSARCDPEICALVCRLPAEPPTSGGNDACMEQQRCILNLGMAGVSLVKTNSSYAGRKSRGYRRSMLVSLIKTKRCIPISKIERSICNAGRSQQNE